MKTLILVLAIVGMLTYGCLGGGVEPTAQPTMEPTITAIAVTIDPSIDGALQESADQIADIDKLTQELGESDPGITDEELNALG